MQSEILLRAAGIGVVWTHAVSKGSILVRQSTVPFTVTHLRAILKLATY